MWITRMTYIRNHNERINHILYMHCLILKQVPIHKVTMTLEVTVYEETYSTLVYLFEIWQR